MTMILGKKFKIDKIIGAALVVLGFIGAVIVGRAEVVADGSQLLFLLPLSFSVACLFSLNRIKYIKGSFGLAILYALITMRYLISPVLIAITGDFVPKLSTVPYGLRFAIFIMTAELFAIVIAIALIWKPVEEIGSKRAASFGKFKLTHTGYIVCVIILVLLSVRGTIPNIFEHLSIGPIFRFSSSNLKTYDMSAFMTLKAFASLLTISLSAKKYHESDNLQEKRKYLLIAIGAALINVLMFDARNRATMAMVAMASLAVLIYCFGKKISRFLPYIAAGGFLFVWVLFSVGTIRVSTEDKASYLAEISRLAELYSNGVSTEAHAYHVYERVTYKMNFLTYISELIKSNNIFTLPGLWFVNGWVKNIPTIQQFFNRTIPEAKGYILPNAGLAIYSAGKYLGIVLDMSFHWLIVYGVYFFHRKKKKSYDVAYVYLYSYCEMICAFALMNNVLIAFSLLTAVPFLLFVMLRINSMGKREAKVWDKFDRWMSKLNWREIMSFKKIKSKLKPVMLMLAPRYYYKRIVKQQVQEMNVNCPYVTPSISIPYNPAGKYPTMYDTQPSFYDKRKQSMKTDENGIPMYEVGGNKVYHPVYMIQYALSEFGFYISSQNKEHFNLAKKIADWLLVNQDKDNGCWYYNYDFKHEMTKCVIKAPWVSAMAQGQAISLLTRIYQTTKDEKYLTAAIKATKMLDIPITSGGLASELWGHTVFEEFPTTPHSYTLNGFMFCALGLYDLSQVTEDKNVATLWNKAKDTLTFMVPLYDGDIMSIYCLSYVSLGNTKRYWADAYNSIHITLLQCFQSFMPNPTFEFYIKRWASFWGITINE